MVGDLESSELLIERGLLHKYWETFVLSLSSLKWSALQNTNPRQFSLFNNRTEPIWASKTLQLIKE